MMGDDTMDVGIGTPPITKTKKCRGCDTQFQPSSGGQAYCNQVCKQQNKQSKTAGVLTPTMIGRKRNGNHMSPHEASSSKKDRRGDYSKEERAVLELSEDDLAKLEPAKITGLFLSLREMYIGSRETIEELTKENRELRGDLTTAKMAFADRALEDFHRQGTTKSSYAAVVSSRAADGGRAVLVAKVEPSASSSPIDLNKIDALLGSTTMAGS